MNIGLRASEDEDKLLGNMGYKEQRLFHRWQDEANQAIPSWMCHPSQVENGGVTGDVEKQCKHIARQ